MIGKTNIISVQSPFDYSWWVKKCFLGNLLSAPVYSQSTEYKFSSQRIWNSFYLYSRNITVNFPHSWMDRVEFEQKFRHLGNESHTTSVMRCEWIHALSTLLYNVLELKIRSTIGASSFPRESRLTMAVRPKPLCLWISISLKFSKPSSDKGKIFLLLAYILTLK